MPCSSYRHLLPASALATLAALLAGCTTPKPAAPPPAAVAVICTIPHAGEETSPGETPVAETRAAAVRPVLESNANLLAYADRLRTLGPAEFNTELARLSDVPDMSRGPYGDLQLAVALGQTRQPQDLQRAQALLQRLAASSSEEARRLQPMGRLLAARYAEQRRVEDLLDKQNQQMRDTQRRIDQLTERLEAVRAIERSLTRPGASAAAPSAPAGSAKP